MSRTITFLLVALLLPLACLGCGGVDGREILTVSPTTALLAGTAVPTTPLSSPTEQTQVTAEPPPAYMLMLGGSVHNKAGGYAYLAIPDYRIRTVHEMTYMSMGDENASPTPTNVFMNGFAVSEPVMLATIYDELLAEITVEPVNRREIVVDDAPGLAADFSRVLPDGRMVDGRFIVVQVTPYQRFIMIGEAPAEQWGEELLPFFEAVVESLRFHELEPPSPSSGEEVSIEAFKGYQDSDGRWRILGLVANHSDEVVTDVMMEIAVSNSSGEAIYSGFVAALMPHIAPGGVSPFTLALPEDLTGVNSYRANIIGYSAAQETNHVAVDISNTRMTIDDNGDIHVTGEIVNPTGERVVVTSLAAAVFAAGEELITAVPSFMFVGDLAPGASAPFRVSMEHWPASGTGAIERYAVYVDAYIAEPNPSDDYAVALGSGDSRTIDSDGNLHLTGEVANADDKRLYVILWAAFYDEEGRVLDADLVYLPPIYLAPGETLPFDFNDWGPLNTAVGLLDQVADYTISWAVLDYPWLSTIEYVDLAVADNQQTFAGDASVFTGQISNNTDEPVDEAFIIVGLRDVASGIVMGTSYETIYDGIPAGERAEYAVSIPIAPNFDQGSVEYFLIVRGLRR